MREGPELVINEKCVTSLKCFNDSSNAEEMVIINVDHVNWSFSSEIRWLILDPKAQS